MQKTVREIISNIDLTELNEWVDRQIKHRPLDYPEHIYRRLIIAAKSYLDPMLAVMFLTWIKNDCDAKIVSKKLQISPYSVWVYLKAAKEDLRKYKDMIYDR